MYLNMHRVCLSMHTTYKHNYKIMPKQIPNMSQHDLKQKYNKKKACLNYACINVTSVDSPSPNPSIPNIL